MVISHCTLVPTVSRGKQNLQYPHSMKLPAGHVAQPALCCCKLCQAVCSWFTAPNKLQSQSSNNTHLKSPCFALGAFLLLGSERRLLLVLPDGTQGREMLMAMLLEAVQAAHPDSKVGQGKGGEGGRKHKGRSACVPVITMCANLPCLALDMAPFE